MFAKDSPFFQRSKKVAEDFLQTTVIVDDQAYFDRPVHEITTPVPSDLITPGRNVQARDAKQARDETDIEKITLPNQEGGSHRLDAQKVINNFAEKRIVCSVIKPILDQDWQSSIESIAKGADIIILDWELNKDSGEKTLNLLGKLLRSANETPEQLRLFAIYTGEPKIVGITKDIKTMIKKELKLNSKEILEQDEGFALVFGPTRIVVFSKPGTTNLLKEYSSRIVEFDNLANRVIEEFTVMTAGLVSNVVINSLSIVRRNTHKILSKFSVLLDSPYLTHRALQTNTEDAEEFLVELIAEEIRTILEEGHAGQGANLDAIKEWLGSKTKPDFVLNLNGQNKTILTEQLSDLLEIGFNSWNITGLSKKNPHKVPLTEMFSQFSENSKVLDEQFSVITTLRSFYEKKIPMLTFGTILQKVSDKSYWVCVQPRCDSVRFSQQRDFPFLPLNKVDDVNTKFRLVIKKKKEYIRLSLGDKPHNLRLISFTPNERKFVAAELNNSDYVFKSTYRSTRYRWAGELKPEQAQRLANEFAANLSRVGLDESEWLRLWATKG